MPLTLPLAIAGAGLAAAGGSLGSAALSRGAGSRSRVGLPGALGQEVLPGLSGIVSLDPARRKEALSRFTLDPDQYLAISGPLSDVALGRTLDVSSRSEVQQLLNAIRSQSNLGLQENLAGLRSRFALAGQSSTGTSSPLLQAQKQATTRVASERDATIARLLSGMLETERDRQLRAIAGLIGYQKTPVDIFSQLAKFYSTSATQETGPGLASAALGALGAGASSVLPYLLATGGRQQPASAYLGGW